MKPYRVDFKYTVEAEASVHVIAESEQLAAEGALEVIKKQDTAGYYGNPEIVRVEEIQPVENPSPSTPKIN